MIIHTAADLDAIAERMGPVATRAAALHMLDALLAAGFDGANTRDISERDWLAAMDVAAEDAAARAEGRS